MKPPAETTAGTTAETTATPAPAPANARVQVITQGIRIGDHICAADHIIESLPLADAEYRAKAGEVIILNLVD